MFLLLVAGIKHNDITNIWNMLIDQIPPVVYYLFVSKC